MMATLKKYFILFQVAVLTILLFTSCRAVEKVDNFIQNFNQHIEGWVTLTAIITAIIGFFGWLINILNKHTELLKSDNVKKSPIISLIKGYGLFHQFNWGVAIESANNIANELTKGKKNYDPTMIVCIGRGGAIFGSLLSYSLSELPILALDRSYTHDDNDVRKERPMYPFRIPKAYLKRVLLVAGESHTRKTLLIFNEKLKALGAQEIRNCVFYKQIIDPAQCAENVVIHYYGVEDHKDYLMPWQTKLSLHPSENKEDAEAQNSKISRYISEKDNRFSVENSGFYCMRHAETGENSRDHFIGSGTNVSLSAKGIKQAQAVGRYFKRIGVSFDYVYCSPLTRCYQTAYEIVKETGGQIITKVELLEFDYGKWEGMSRKDIENTYPKEYLDYCTNTDGTFCPPGGSEKLNDVKQRVMAFVSELRNSQTMDGAKVLVVTHKTIGRILYQLVSNNNNMNFREISMKNASIGFVAFQEGQMRIILDNKTCDLK